MDKITYLAPATETIAVAAEQNILSGNAKGENMNTRTEESW